jgi:hypothetical protein
MAPTGVSQFHVTSNRESYDFVLDQQLHAVVCSGALLLFCCKGRECTMCGKTQILPRD